LESFSCGTPVISTDVGGISEFFPENFGQLIPVNDETALLDFLRHFKPASSQQQRAMHAYAQRLFSYQSIANQFTELYYSSLSHAANLSD
jgi:glycosyltransferase involved in cell wall biosynthesis